MRDRAISPEQGRVALLWGPASCCRVRQGLLFADVFAQLASPWASGNFPASIPISPYKTEVIVMCYCSGFWWDLGIWTRVFMIEQQRPYPLSYFLSTVALFTTIIFVGNKIRSQHQKAGHTCMKYVLTKVFNKCKKHSVRALKYLV